MACVNFKVIYEFEEGEYLLKSQRDQINHCLVKLADVVYAFVRINNEKKKVQKKKKMVK